MLSCPDACSALAMEPIDFRSSVVWLRLDGVMLHVGSGSQYLGAELLCTA